MGRRCGTNLRGVDHSRPRGFGNGRDGASSRGGRSHRNGKRRKADCGGATWDTIRESGPGRVCFLPAAFDGSSDEHEQNEEQGAAVEQQTGVEKNSTVHSFEPRKHGLAVGAAAPALATIAASARVDFAGTAVAAATDAGSNFKAPVLDSLAVSELSNRYGLGFKLLCGMGYQACGNAGLREGSLPTPIRPHEQGSDERGRVSRRGIGTPGEEDVVEGSRESLPTPLAIGAGMPMEALLKEVLATMREAGDSQQAIELERLAAAVGSVETDPSQQVVGRRKRKRGVLPGPRVADSDASSDDERDGNIDHNPQPTVADRAPLEILLEALCGDVDFPVDLDAQSRSLHWAHRWEHELGKFKAFVDRNDESLRLVPCPAPHGSLVLPRKVPEGAWTRIHSGKYVEWCHSRRPAANNRLKRKWKHLEKIIARICHGLERGGCSILDNQLSHVTSEEAKEDDVERKSEEEQKKGEEKAAEAEEEGAAKARLTSSSIAAAKTRRKRRKQERSQSGMDANVVTHATSKNDKGEDVENGASASGDELELGWFVDCAVNR